MSQKRTILVVEDERSICNFICRALNANNYHTISAENGKLALSLLFSHQPDIVLLDLGLPDMDGMQVLKEVIDFPKFIPVIIISARDREIEKVQALDAGADDYIVKPFGISELLARIRTALRRADHMRATSDEEIQRYQIKNLCLDTAKHQVFLGDNEIHFTQNEFKILHLLCLHAGRVLTYDFILQHVWGPLSGTNNQILRVNIANIRRKLGENPSDPAYILTELGVGYRMLEE